MTNPICQACHKAHNSINGRYCHTLKRYVEHDRRPRCNEESKDQRL